MATILQSGHIVGWVLAYQHPSEGIAGSTVNFSQRAQSSEHISRLFLALYAPLPCWNEECTLFGELGEGHAMPYLRLYSPYLPLEQKQVIGQKLIDITLRAFRLPAEQRYRTSIQFITRGQVRTAESPRLDIASNADFTLVVIGHHLTEREKRDFAEEAAGMLNNFVPRSLPRRIASLLGIKSDLNQRVAFQFSEFTPAVSDPFLMHSERRAA